MPPPLAAPPTAADPSPTHALLQLYQEHTDDDGRTRLEVTSSWLERSWEDGSHTPNICT